jgi:hypothetical protein
MNESEVAACVWATLSAAPNGLTRKELQEDKPLEGFGPQAMLRILRRLEGAGTIGFVGNTRVRRYVARVPPVAVPAGSLGEGAVPLSLEAQECLRQVSGPLSSRKPVSYRREFLDLYRFGDSDYLPQALRAHLASLGRTNALDQPAGTYAREVLERFLLELAWNSSRLEGNTYSLLDTERLLAEGAAEGRDLRETQMLLNHKAAIEYLVDATTAPAVDPHTVKTLNALLMENLLGNRLDEGRVRSIPVQIGGSVFVPLANPQLVEECFRQMLYTAQAIPDPFEKAFFLLVQVPYLQPFVDGNKRTARLAANIPLIVGNLVPLSFADVPRELFLKANLAVYELNRVDLLRDLFVWAYARSAARLGQVRSSLGEPDPFRLKHRQLLRELVAQLVRAKTPKAKVKQAIMTFAKRRLGDGELPRFIAMGEIELETLHDGNFARYGLRPSEYEAWCRSRRR